MAEMFAERCSGCGTMTSHMAGSLNCQRELQRQRDEARAQVSELTVEVEQVREERQRWRDKATTLRALLREMEWFGVNETPPDVEQCLFCDAPKWRGHAPDCRLKAALEGQ